jgi:pSer/pThr/pTyr-binding forkhead associated (FHA) protein
MPLLIFGAQRRELRVGNNTIGGTEDIVFPALEGFPRLAVIALTANGEATIASLGGDTPVTVDGVLLGGEPKPLRDGSSLQVGHRCLVYRAESKGEESVVVTGESDGWKLIELQTGRIHDIPTRGMVIGRDDDCDLVVSAHNVSRRHAVIRKVGTGYTVTDESANGTFVNDVRVQAEQTLARGDKLRIGTAVFRLERSATTGSLTGAETHRFPSVVVPGLPSDSDGNRDVAKAPRRSGPVGLTELAVLEVIRGPLGGTRFPLTRAVCSIGRTEDNDIVIADESVSSSHATIMQKAGSWYVVDLRSANGTYIDGYRVAAERMLSEGSVLTIGQVKMVFLPATNPGQQPHGTQPLLGMFRHLAKLLRSDE